MCCSRSKDVIEPRIKEQWYINCDDMATKAIEVLFQTLLHRVFRVLMKLCEYFT